MKCSSFVFTIMLSLIVFPPAAEPDVDATDAVEVPVLPAEADPVFADELLPDDDPPHPASETATAAVSAIATILFFISFSFFYLFLSFCNEFVKIARPVSLILKKN